MVVGGAVRQRSKQEKWDWDSRWERKGERGRGREREDNRFSPNLTLSINLTSSSRRKGPVCPGTLPDSRRVRHRAHTRHHYLPGRASPRDRRGTPRRPLGNTLPPLPTLLDSFVDQPSLGRFCPRPFSPQHRFGIPRSTVLISFVPKVENSPLKAAAGRASNRMENLTTASDTFWKRVHHVLLFPRQQTALPLDPRQIFFWCKVEEEEGNVRGGSIFVLLFFFSFFVFG